MQRKELKNIIQTYPRNTFTRNDKILFERYRDYLNEFSALAMLKFLKGRVEHNEDISEIDCTLEISNELMDITAYQFIKTL